MKDVKRLSAVLGRYQDAVVLRTHLLDLAVAARENDESAFTYGVLVGQVNAELSRHAEQAQAWWAARHKRLRWK